MPGRVVVIKNQNHLNALGVILHVGSLATSTKFSTTSREPLEKIYTILILCDKTYDSIEENSESKQRGNENVEHHHSRFLSKDVFQPQGQNSQVVEEIYAASIVDIVNKMLKLDYVKLIDNHKKKLIPRFRYLVIIYHNSS